MSALTPRGAFVNFYGGASGFVPLRQLASPPPKSPAGVVSVGQVVRCRVTTVDADRQRISLSLIIQAKAAASAAPVPTTSIQLNRDQFLQQYKSVHEGSLVNGTVLAIDNEKQLIHVGVTVSGDDTVAGSIAFAHTSDTDTYRVPNVNDSLKKLLVLRVVGEKIVRLQLSHKKSLLQAKKEKKFPSNMEQVKENQIYKGIKKIPKQLALIALFCRLHF